MSKNSRPQVAPPTNLENVFRAAEVFRRGGDLLGDYAMRQNQPELISPTVACAALGLEILFKCLILLEGKTYGKIHALTDLFAILSDETKKKIRDRYQPYLPQDQKEIERAIKESGGGEPIPTVDFDYILAQSSRAFENVRYAYEGPKTESWGWLASDIYECTRAVILEKEPGWANLVYVTNEPPSPIGGPSPR
jgi:hypothetical protein